MTALLPATPALADYPLEPGDVLDFAVTGIPNLAQRVTVAANGEASFPLVGEINVAGFKLGPLRSQLRESIPLKAYIIRGQDGRDIVTAISGEQISLAVVTYRPVYLLGDVARPGEQPFRPGLTAAQAVSAAGGYDLIRYRVENPLLQAVDLRAEYENLWTEFAREQAKITRLRSETARDKEMRVEGLSHAPTPPSLLNEIVRLESDRLRVRLENDQRERNHLQNIVAAADERLKVLSAQLRREEEGAADDQKEVERMSELFRRNVVPVTRTVEARRLSLVSATRALQVASQLESSRRERLQAARALEKLGEDRALQVGQEMEDATLRLSSIGRKIQAVGEKLLYTGVVRQNLSRGRTNSAKVTISRKVALGGRQKLDGTEDTELNPGDIVEILLPAPDLAGSLQ